MNNNNPKFPLFFHRFPYASSLNVFPQSVNETSLPSPAPESQKKKVCFFDSVAVILIPERKEYNDAQLNDVLWFNDEDYKMIQKATRDELKEFVQENPHISAKKALNLFYELHDVHPENVNLSKFVEIQEGLDKMKAIR